MKNDKKLISKRAEDAVKYTEENELKGNTGICSGIFYDLNMDIIRQAHEDEIF